MHLLCQRRADFLHAPTSHVKMPPPFTGRHIADDQDTIRRPGRRLCSKGRAAAAAVVIHTFAPGRQPIPAHTLPATVVARSPSALLIYNTELPFAITPFSRHQSRYAEKLAQPHQRRHYFSATYVYSLSQLVYGTLHHAKRRRKLGICRAFCHFAIAASPHNVHALAHATVIRLTTYFDFAP